MADPYLVIRLGKLEHNARTIRALCAAHGIRVTGVTKGTCGSPEVAWAMLRAGVAGIGESRMDNVRRLRAAGLRAPLMLLRAPPPSEVDEVVAHVDVSLNSELAVLRGLSETALRHGRLHDVIVMVDLGDLREGVWPDDLVPFVREAAKLCGVRIVGLGTNLTCYGGVVPSEENMERLVAHAHEVEQVLGRPLERVSGGNSSALTLIAAGSMPGRVDHVRIGEAILLGRETIHRRPWPSTFQDVFELRAEVIECKEKPSVPIGERAEDAFGHVPHFADVGERDRAILNIGREDVDPEGLRPLDPGISVLGASSDCLIVDVTRARRPVGVGDEVTFSVGYGALLAAMTSQYVEKRFEGSSPPPPTPARPATRC